MLASMMRFPLCSAFGCGLLLALAGCGEEFQSETGGGGATTTTTRATPSSSLTGFLAGGGGGGGGGRKTGSRKAHHAMGTARGR